MVLHSRTLDRAMTEDEQVVNTFLDCVEMEENLVLATPMDDDSSQLLFRRAGIHAISYRDHRDGFDASYKTDDEEHITFCRTQIPPSMITHLYGYREGNEEFEEISNAFRDLIAFESIAREDSGAIFVTQDQRLLEKRIWIQSRFRVKILSFLQALEYFDLFLKKHDLYYASPTMRRVDGKAFHYWFLLKELMPNFARAWSVSVFGKDVIPNGEAVQKSLISLSDRFQNALCASDRIAMEYVKYPTNSTEWEMIYNLNYFLMLVTGIFDSLAWLTVHRYPLPIRSRLDVTIRIGNQRSRGAKFVRLVSPHNSSLSDFIRDQKDFVNLFYPMRDSIQHRDPMRGALFMQRSNGWVVSLTPLTLDAFEAIHVVDQSGTPFTDWGIVEEMGPPDGGGLLEPHRFSRKASRRLMTFVDRYLEILDLPSLITSHREVARRVAEAQSSEPEPPFIAKVYLARGSHLPVLFRPR